MSRAGSAAALALVLLVGACGGSSPSTTPSASTRPVVRRVATTTSAPTTTTALATTSTAPPVATTAAPAVPAGRDTTVSYVVDGDTIVVAGGEHVRLIGIDTPEIKDPRKPVQCFGAEASAYTKSILPPGTPVRLVADVEPQDRYGRTLAYVYRLTDGVFVNADLVAGGYASAYTYPPNVAHSDWFVALAAQARDAGRGLWGACGGPGVPVSGGGTTATTVPTATGSCDPAYPGVCIPPPPPDLDCGDITYRRFQVLPPDPHRFDSDGDGIGCES